MGTRQNFQNTGPPTKKKNPVHHKWW